METEIVKGGIYPNKNGDTKPAKPYRLVNTKTRKVLDARADVWQYCIIDGTLVWICAISLYREGAREFYGR